MCYLIINSDALVLGIYMYKYRINSIYIDKYNFLKQHLNLFIVKIQYITLEKKEKKISVYIVRSNNIKKRKPEKNDFPLFILKSKKTKLRATISYLYISN